MLGSIEIIVGNAASHVVVACVSNFAKLLITKTISLERRILLRAPLISARAAKNARAGIPGRIRRPSCSAAANDGRKHKKPLGITYANGSCSASASLTVLALDIRRRDAGSTSIFELVDLVVVVTVIDGAALAKGEAVDNAADVGVVVEVRGAVVPFARVIVHVAEDHAAAGDGANVATDGDKMGLVSAGRNAKATILAHRNAVDDVVAAHDAADDTAKERGGNAVVGVLGAVGNRVCLAGVLHAKVAHHAAVAVGD